MSQNHSKTLIQIHWAPSLDDEKPLYIQIADFMTDKIQSGDWAEGSYLPSQRELASQFKVNRSTIVTALEALKSIGLLETYGKGGTRVAPSTMTLRTSSPDWAAHITEGFHFSNLDTIQIINRSEFSGKMIRLSSGEPSPEWFPKEQMAEVLGDIGRRLQHLGYEEPKGMLYLREQVCDYVKGFGIHTKPENVLVVSGALQAIQLISMGLLQPGSTVFLEKPSYLYSLSIFQSIGMRRVGLSMDSEGVLTDQILPLKPKHRQALLYTVPNFHNPTGIVMSEKRRQALFDVTGKAQIPIVEDDVYRELWIEEPPPSPIKSYDQHGNVLYVGSVSKTLSTGLRIGWMIGPESVVDRLGDLKMQNDYGSSSLAQLVAGEFLEKGYYTSHAAQVRSQLRVKRDLAEAALRTYFSAFADWHHPTGGYYFWLTFKVPLHAQGLFEDAYKKGILTYPGYLYDSNLTHSLRISYSYASQDELLEGIRVLSELVKLRLNK